MEQIDERILEYISENGWVSPGILYQERGFNASKGRIRERCKTLQYAGFVYPIGSEMYDLTTDGILFLRGEVDARHCPEPTPSRVFGDRFPTPGRWPQARYRRRWF